MIEETQLDKRFSYVNFSSYYYSEYMPRFKSLSPETESDSEIFDMMVKNIYEEGISSSKYRFACFGRFQDSFPQESWSYFKEPIAEDIKLYLVINTNMLETRTFGQWCWMTRDELVSHINLVKTLFDGFEVLIEPDLRENFMCLKFIFEKGKISQYKIRFLLTWMRYSYEFASSMAMRDAYLISEMYPEMSIFNLMQATVKFSLNQGVLEDQTICPGGGFLDSDVLINNLDNPTTKQLEDLYPPVPSWIYSRGRDINVKSNQYQSINWWMDEDTFKEIRLPIHIKNIESITKYCKENEPKKSN